LSLEPGKRLGPYEIVAPLGAGGMGEVYKARDTRLDRTVAIKLLPASLTDSPERRQRLEREARAVSALNHAHICALYDVGDQDGSFFLVMEYLEGETLADRLTKGALPTEQVLRYGIEIGDALDKAHKKGIVHRDLKPGNVVITKAGAKLLDFGLAKLRGEAASPTPELSSLPTEAKPLTQAGTILGTLRYMAPEQLEGGDADSRADIWALGLLLYEMATGKPAFSGKSQASLIGAILKDEPAPISATQTMAPPALDRLVRTCLAKDPDERWQSAHDVVQQLRWIGEAGSQAGVPAPVAERRRSRERLAWTVAAIAAVLGAALGFLAARLGRRVEPLQVRLKIAPPEGTRFPWWTLPAVSPDGSKIAFTAVSGQVAADRASAAAAGESHLYIRALDAETATRIPGTEGAYWPFWSPDGRQIGFATFPPQPRLRKVDVSGGPPQTLCDLTSAHDGASWSRDGVILFAQGGALYRVPAGGGEAKRLDQPDPKQANPKGPQFLPDGRFLYLSMAERQQDRALYLGSLDGKERTRVLTTDRIAAYVPSGHLLFMNGQVLSAQAFDRAKRRLEGDPFPVAERVVLMRGLFGGAAFSVSPGGVLAWRTGAATETMQLTWFDRSGKKLGAVGPPAEYSNPALSPDERSLAVGQAEAGQLTRDLWVFDLVRGTRTRLTFDPGDDLNPTWSPDGRRMAFSSTRGPTRDILEKAADGSGDERRLFVPKEGEAAVEDWSADGRLLLFNRQSVGQSADLYVLPLTGAERQPLPLLATPFSESMGQFSPNGRFVAYRSSESGRSEVYVQAIDADGKPTRGKWQVSTNGGLEPRWRRDGRELFYVNDSTLFAVDVKIDGAAFEAGIPKALFDLQLPDPRRNRFVVSRDGQRFLFNAAAEQASDAPIQVLVNWRPPKR
jgi:Tol biopolymer transport system component/predicted Ser/Thr protein kinase